MAKGQKVVTEGGIHGSIVKTEEDTVTIEIESGARFKLEKDQISNDRTALRYKIRMKSISKAVIIKVFYAFTFLIILVAKRPGWNLYF